MRTYAKGIVFLLGGIFLFTPLSNGYNWDPEPPVTEIMYEKETGYVTLVAVDYPIYHSSGVNVTYFKLDGGGQKIYTEPFFIGEGGHIIEYWSVDNLGYVEVTSSAYYLFDGTPPTVEFYYPEPGLYLLGNKLLPLSNNIICIGKVPIAVDAYDEISGVQNVYFNVRNDTGYDAKSPFEYTYRDTSFGDLSITAYAEDNYGRISETIEMTITCYSLGLM